MNIAEVEAEITSVRKRPVPSSLLTPTIPPSTSRPKLGSYPQVIYLDQSHDDTAEESSSKNSFADPHQVLIRLKSAFSSF
jgi:hypothetical protein